MPSEQSRLPGDASGAHASLPCRPLPESTLRRVASEALLRVATTPSTRAGRIPRPAPKEVARLCEALLEPGAMAGQTAIEALLAAGIGRSTLMLGHLPEAARQLGEMWERDEVSFIQVGQAVGRLQRLMRVLRAPGEGRTPHAGRRALFATMPGETHTLGVIIAADACRERGWAVDLSLGEDRQVLLDEIANNAYPLLGLSVGSARTCAALADLLPDLRAAAPQTPFLLAGSFVATSPWRVRSLPVDGWAKDVTEALSEMARLVEVNRAG